MTRGLSHRGNIVREQIRRTGLDCISKRKPALNPMRTPASSKAKRLAPIRTTRIAGGLLLGYNPWKAGARLKTPAFTLFRPYCP